MVRVSRDLGALNNKHAMGAKKFTTLTAKAAAQTEQVAVVHTSLRSLKKWLQAAEARTTLRKIAAPS